MNLLQKALSKEASKLTDEEKSIIQKNWDILNDDLRSKFKDVAPDEEDEEEGDEDEEEKKEEDEDDEVDEKALVKLINKSSRKFIDDKCESIAKNLVKSFADKVADQKAKFLQTGVEAQGKSKENDEITREFLHALKAKDVATLKRLGMKTGEKAIDTTSDGSGADAGYLIPEPLANQVLRIESVGYGKARDLFAYNLLTEGNTKRVTALGSTLSVYWVDEGEKKPSSTPAFSLVTLALKKLAVIVPMTEESVEDSGVNLTELVAQLIREAIDQEVDNQFFNGDGTVWTGIFNDTSIPTDELTANDDGADIRPEHILALADNTSLSVNGKYIMHRTVLSKVRTLRQNADGTGDYLYNPLGAGSDSQFGTLNGYPVELVEAAPTYAETLGTSTPNLPIMMFGDFKRGVAYGEKSGVKLKLLDQATITDTDGETVLNLAEQDMLALRAVQRVGMKVTLASAMRRLVTGD